MIQFLRGHLRILIWFTVGLVCVLLLALGLPFIQLATATNPNHQNSSHAYTPKNPKGTPYWSSGITRDSNHLPDL
ncbi:MAG: hypothetical protein KME49_02105 [Brasilonema octagenarum HA4186-MV1]|uniref:hypothetical protein n=1 Tax=Brasilonema sennae TaxID=1397703 RepID=UPI00145C84BD|nr:hypothetical protein [Brasilonema sennae]MBP5972090.1 hypothetical protein [Brasilonema sp. CT11]MBW4624323.1 hypothetical protein [Brasilonema octagenarum HA4186-MV1]